MGQNWIDKKVNRSFKIQEGNTGIVGDSVKCRKCGSIHSKETLKNKMYTCSNCDFHLYMPVLDRFESLFDEKQFTIIPSIKVKPDPLEFTDIKTYKDRYETYVKKTKFDDALVSARGKIGGRETIISILNFEFMGGSMGTSVGENLINAMKIALTKKLPFIVFTASGGARMQEGILSLMQMARTTVMVNKLKAHGIPYIVCLTNPTTGGVTASFAMIGDIHIAEKGAIIGFAGARVIEQTIKEILPDGFQTAEYLLEKGMVDIVINRKNLKNKLCDILSIL